MAARILITMDDLETAVPLNAALRGGRLLHRDVLLARRRPRQPSAARRPSWSSSPARSTSRTPLQLAALARDAEISTLALLEPTDSERAERVGRLGVTETMMKPVAPDEAVATARRLIERRRLQQRTGIIGESAPIQEVLVKIEQMAPVSSTVLIQGESGTGKELVAQGASTTSRPRRGKPFIAVNCAALPETLLESELFGHEKGAFTGAAERRLGRFELADTGTLFLDEIGEIPPAHPGEAAAGAREPRRSSGWAASQPIKVDVRVVAATNRPLRDAVALGEFRDDLYYRLNVLNIYLPPLRERREDIPLLVRRFIREFARRARPARSAGITPEAMQLLVERALARATSASSGT